MISIIVEKVSILDFVCGNNHFPGVVYFWSDWNRKSPKIPKFDLLKALVCSVGVNMFATTILQDFHSFSNSNFKQRLAQLRSIFQILLVRDLQQITKTRKQPSCSNWRVILMCKYIHDEVPLLFAPLVCSVSVSVYLYWVYNAVFSCIDCFLFIWFCPPLPLQGFTWISPQTFPPLYSC